MSGGRPRSLSPALTKRIEQWFDARRKSHVTAKMAIMKFQLDVSERTVQRLFNSFGCTRFFLFRQGRIEVN